MSVTQGAPWIATGLRPDDKIFLFKRGRMQPAWKVSSPYYQTLDQHIGEGPAFPDQVPIFGLHARDTDPPTWWGQVSASEENFVILNQRPLPNLSAHRAPFTTYLPIATVRHCPTFVPFTDRLERVGNSQANEELVFLGNSDGYPGEYSALATSDGSSSFWMSTHCIKTLRPADGLDERVAAVIARLRQGLIQPMPSYADTVDTEPFMFDGWPQTEISYDELAALFQYSTDEDRYLLESDVDAYFVTDQGKVVWDYSDRFPNQAAVVAERIRRTEEIASWLDKGVLTKVDEKTYAWDLRNHEYLMPEDALRLKLRLAVLLATERLGEIEVAVLESVSDPNQGFVIIGDAYAVEAPSSHKSTHITIAHTHPVEDTNNSESYPLRVARGFSMQLEGEPRTGLFVSTEGGDVATAFVGDRHTEYVLAPFLSETDEVEFVVADFSQLWSTRSETITARFHTPFGIVTGVPTPIRY